MFIFGIQRWWKKFKRAIPCLWYIFRQGKRILIILRAGQLYKLTGKQVNLKIRTRGNGVKPRINLLL